MKTFKICYLSSIQDKIEKAVITAENKGQARDICRKTCPNVSVILSIKELSN